ncbi:MAG: hypothetical protein OJF50_006458 [Nitrospira sp.]|jgi:hypothetical protein|nr:hypothetical protein [Nitrospira sp.]
MFGKIKNAILYLWDRLFPPIRVEEDEDSDDLIIVESVVIDGINEQDSTPREEL